MQNEELQLDASQPRYFNLYNLKPIGYFTLSEKGVIIEANLTSSKMLNVVSHALINQSIKNFV